MMVVYSLSRRFYVLNSGLLIVKGTLKTIKIALLCNIAYPEFKLTIINS